MKTKKILQLFLFLFCIQSLSAQNIERLKENNGFREIKLGSDVKDYPAFIKKDSTNSKYFGLVGYEYEYIFEQGVKAGYDKVGDAEIYRILAKTFNGKIFKINVTLEKDYGTIKMLKLAFGEPNFENMELGMLRWNTENNIECEFMGHIDLFKNDFVRFTDLNIKKLYEKDKKEKEKKRAISEF
jgi:hypothetical protein